MTSFRFSRSFPVTAILGLALLWVGCNRQESTPFPPAVIQAMNRGVALMNQYDYDGAAKAFEEVLRADPKLVDAQVNLAMALFNRGRKPDRDLDRAGEILNKALQQDPNHIRALYFMGIIQQHNGKADLSIPYFEKVLAQRPNDGAAWYLLSLSKQRLNQPAEQDLLKALEHRPYLFSCYYRLWQMAMAAGETNKATGYLDQFKALRESPLGETIELPQYNAMGDLALVAPLPKHPPAITRSHYEPQAWKALEFTAKPGTWNTPSKSSSLHGGAAAADFNRDGYPDLTLLVPAATTGRANELHLLLSEKSGKWKDATSNSGLGTILDARNVAIGDFDNDDLPDLLIAQAKTWSIWKGQTNAAFTNVLAQPFAPDKPSELTSAASLDIDHDGDLDILVCGVGGLSVWINNANGTVTHRGLIPAQGEGTTSIVAADMDRDRDLDLVTLNNGGPVQILHNELLGVLKPSEFLKGSVRSDSGGTAQDFNGDGLLDFLALDPAGPALYLGDGFGAFQPSDAFTSLATSLNSWGPLRAIRVADTDLDGDLDVVILAADVHLLLNDAQGRFVLQPQVWKRPEGLEVTGMELLDFDGDLIPDLLLTGGSSKGPSAFLALGKLTPPSTGLGLRMTGIRLRDGRTRSPASGYGVQTTARFGLRESTVLFTGFNGGPNQSQVPVCLGLNGAPKADYVRFLWPDGVMQVETALAPGQLHTISELQRKISSCPVLFTWNGTRMEFVTDFAGVGGLGYFAAPGEYGQPQVLEHIKIEPNQLQAKNGSLELRISEPMEESAYIDRLELQAVDHPANWRVFPDERAVATGPGPTHELLVVSQPIYPVGAHGPSGEDCIDRIRTTDRVYAYDPQLDRRFIGFCQPHEFTLDFGAQLEPLDKNKPVYLFISGFIEYPYSQTVYAASQSDVNWQAVRVDIKNPNGQWEALVPEGGWPGGMGRVFTLNLGTRSWNSSTALRLTSNLEVYYDEIYLAQSLGASTTRVTTVPMQVASLHKLGFPREYSPDGRMPTIYDYDLIDASAPFHQLKGDYTRYGDVRELLQAFDDQYVIMGPGDEIALSFNASSLPPLPPGQTRSYILVSHSYCKDMDLYTATPQTLEPLPFRAMTRYPYPDQEGYPDTRDTRAYRNLYNTRQVR